MPEAGPGLHRRECAGVWQCRHKTAGSPYLGIQLLKAFARQPLLLHVRRECGPHLQTQRQGQWG